MLDLKIVKTCFEDRQQSVSHSVVFCFAFCGQQESCEGNCQDSG